MHDAVAVKELQGIEDRGSSAHRAWNAGRSERDGRAGRKHAATVLVHGYPARSGRSAIRAPQCPVRTHRARHQDSAQQLRVPVRRAQHDARSGSTRSTSHAGSCAIAVVCVRPARFWRAASTSPGAQRIVAPASRERVPVGPAGTARTTCGAAAAPRYSAYAQPIRVRWAVVLRRSSTLSHHQR